MNTVQKQAVILEGMPHFLINYFTKTSDVHTQGFDVVVNEVVREHEVVGTSSRKTLVDSSHQS